MKNILFIFCLLTSVLCSEELEQRLFAVHVTRSFPHDGILKAGIFGFERINKMGIPESLFPNFRMTLHFSLGEMVRPVEGVISWEKCPYAVVTPLSDLMPQLVNINCYDTFILGDYKLTAQATLILPITYRHKLGREIAIHYYDPTKTTLRVAVDAVIKKRGGWKIDMLSNDVEDELNEAFLNKKNINTIEFFSPLLKKIPDLSIGTRFNKVHGDAYLLGQFDNLGVELVRPYLTGDEPEWQEGKVAAFEKALHSVKKYIKPDMALLARKWIDIVKTDIKMRKKEPACD